MVLEQGACVRIPYFQLKTTESGVVTFLPPCTASGTPNDVISPPDPEQASLKPFTYGTCRVGKVP